MPIFLSTRNVPRSICPSVTTMCQDSICPSAPIVLVLIFLGAHICFSAPKVPRSISQSPTCFGFHFSRAPNVLRSICPCAPNILKPICPGASNVLRLLLSECPCCLSAHFPCASTVPRPIYPSALIVVGPITAINVLRPICSMA